MTDYPEHHWSECHGNQFFVNPTLGMLNSTGVQVLRNTGVKGESKAKDRRKSLKLITYDRAYVAKYILVKLGEVIGGVSRAELLKLITEAKSLKTNDTNVPTKEHRSVEVSDNGPNKPNKKAGVGMVCESTGDKDLADADETGTPDSTAIPHPTT